MCERLLIFIAYVYLVNCLSNIVHKFNGRWISSTYLFIVLVDLILMASLCASYDIISPIYLSSYPCADNNGPQILTILINTLSFLLHGDITWKEAYFALKDTVYPKKYAHGFVVLCFVVVIQSIIMNSHEVFIHIHQGCFAGTGAIVRLPQCQWSKPDGYGKINQCITTTKHSKAKTVCIFLGIYCTYSNNFTFRINGQ